MTLAPNGVDEVMRRLAGSFRWHMKRMPERVVERGVPPAWLGWRWVGRERVPAHVARTGRGSVETVHPAAVFHNPLPRNVPDRDSLPADAGWWGYSMRDVPARPSDPTFIARVPDCRLLFFTEPAKGNFYPAILAPDGRALELREIAFRPGHREMLRGGAAPQRLDRATWVAERVYHNHSHWLTAHLPKLRLLQQRGGLGEVVMPARRGTAIDASLRLLGIDPAGFRTVDTSRPLEVGELTLLGTDRFRPELLRAVRDAVLGGAPSRPHRRVFISRAKARGRHLRNEAALWPLLARAGFERVVMEEMPFEAQVALMAETSVLLAPHGAGLTNMMFCPEGAQVVEIADPAYPNPNFYALAGAMGHGYWLIPGQAHGDGHALDRDLSVDEGAVAGVLRQLEAGA